MQVETLSEYVARRVPQCQRCDMHHNSEERCKCDGMLKLRIPTDKELVDEYRVLIDTLTTAT